ncbi:MAG: helix-turn-helix transcriptional regulator [Clostridiales bacterium]|nr:helix-turn-helix transcriptional regulator [Clostridiales bacterium]
MENTHPHLIACHMLEKALALDIICLDSKGNTVIQLDNTGIPQLFEELRNIDYSEIFHNVMETTQATVTLHMGKLGTTYIATPLLTNGTLDKVFIVGPVLHNEPDEKLIMDTIFLNQFPSSFTSTLTEYLQSLPINEMTQSESIGQLVFNIISEKMDNIPVEYTSSETDRINLEPKRTNRTEQLDQIVARYEFEKHLIHAVSKGDLEEVNSLRESEKQLVKSEMFISTNLLRSYKLFMFTINTLYSRAILEGGVHPIYAHDLSQSFYIQIEKCKHMTALASLHKNMLESYCNAVKTLSLLGYSDIIKQVIEYIRLNLASPLSLKQLADLFHVNASYLSGLFSKEVQMSLTDFIHRERVEEAKFHMRTGSRSIIDIAVCVGFNDSSYFTRVFKRLEGITPSEYMRNHLY